MFIHMPDNDELKKNANSPYKKHYIVKFAVSDKLTEALSIFHYTEIACG